LNDSFDELTKRTKQELLERLKACSPTFFERTVVALLVAMGYGGTGGTGQATGQSGDGGIDGTIYMDELGLDIICIQAKRYNDTTVGRPAIQGFVGSMDLHRAKKGVFLTTSEFTKDADEYVSRIEGKKVVLIDGDRLADLMLVHNVGVTTTAKYELKELSNDFFDEDME
jgi:restriction system protein